jgi:hypothetical protein
VDDYPIYNPLDYENLAKNVADKLMDPATPARPLPLRERFNGAGVYALFYTGDFPPYAVVRSPDATQPIYVGKAAPPGGRKGTAVLDPLQPLRDDGPFLYNRIADHVRSIGAVDNIKAEDFLCRVLRVTPVWITMAERLLILRYLPIWNGGLDGFGLHDPGGGRSPEVSWWDAMHPGRPEILGWKANIRYTRTMDDAISHLEGWLKAPEPELSDEDEGVPK